MKTFFRLIVLLVTATWACAGNAHNTFFLPGDAFFHTVLTEEVLNRIENQKNPVFTYSRPRFLANSLCGSAGFSKLEFRGMPVKFKKQLREVYNNLRESVPKRIEITDEIIWKKGDIGDVAVKTGTQINRELNGFSIFVVNADFNLAKHILGLKYNEDWADQVTAFSHDRNHVRLESFIQTPEAIAVDWRDSQLVAPLSTECPPITNKNIAVPVLAAPTCKFLVFEQPDLRQLTDADNLDAMYEISESGVTRYTKNGKHWVRHKVRHLTLSQQFR